MKSGVKHKICLSKTISFEIVSTSSRAKHISKKDVWKFSNNVGVLVLSTPFGVLSDREAKLLGTGGKVLLYVC